MTEILFNSKIYTQDNHLPIATALAIQDDRILAVGNDQDILSVWHPGDNKYDLAGKVILPGLIDSHIHLGHYSQFIANVDCETDTKEECLHRISQKANNTRKLEWIQGHGWNQNNWVFGYGTAKDLDLVAPNNPVYLTSKSIHAAWANSAALHIAGINKDTPDPEGGVILRNEDGEPNGILLETAMALVENQITKPDVSKMVENIQNAQSALWQMGLTGVHDFDNSSVFAALQILDGNNRLKLRVQKSIPFPDMGEAIRVGIRSGFGSDHLWIGPVKFFADGALGPQTAAMFEPYENDELNSGMLLMSAEEIYENGLKANQAGLSMAIHAIGDRANHEVIDAYSRLSCVKFDYPPRLPNRIEHVQIVRKEDTQSFSKYNIIASVQPIHAPSDMEMADRYWGKRTPTSYAYKSLIDQNALTIFGSDAPVESPNPFWGIHSAVTRKRRSPASTPGWNSQECISISQAIQGYTTNPAMVAGVSTKFGKIKKGFFADLIICDQDPYQIAEDDLYRVKPLGTMIGGSWVWQDESFG